MTDAASIARPKSQATALSGIELRDVVWIKTKLGGNEDVLACNCCTLLALVPSLGMTKLLEW